MRILTRESSGGPAFCFWYRNGQAHIRGGGPRYIGNEGSLSWWRPYGALVRAAGARPVFRSDGTIEWHRP